MVVTACSKNFLGTTFAVNADLDGFPNTNVIESIPVAKYICHGTKIFLNDKIVSTERTIKLNDCVREINFFLCKKSANTPP